MPPSRVHTPPLAGVSGVATAWVPVVAGGGLGIAAAAAHHAAVRHVWRAPPEPLRVVVTGGSCGIGKALAREFLRCLPAAVKSAVALAEAGCSGAARRGSACLPPSRVPCCQGAPCISTPSPVMFPGCCCSPQVRRLGCGDEPQRGGGTARGGAAAGGGGAGRTRDRRVQVQGGAGMRATLASPTPATLAVKRLPCSPAGACSRTHPLPPPLCRCQALPAT